MKKVIHVVGDSKFGGASIIVLKLAKMARGLGCDVSILTTDPKSISFFSDQGFGVVVLNLVRRKTTPIKDLMSTIKLALFFKKNHFDLIHTHTTKGGLVGRLAARLAGCPNIVHTVHGFAFHEETGRVKTFLYATVEKIAAFWCHHIITVSQFHRTWALNLGIGNELKLVAIPNGIQVPEVTSLSKIENLRNEFHLDADTVLLFCAGRLARQKGLEYLLQAMPSVNDLCGKSVKLIIAGEGELLPSLKAQAFDLGLDADAIFIGFRSDVVDLLRTSDLVVLPSLWEGLSISLLEAMATGKAIITTTIGSNLEATHNGAAAKLVPPKNSQELAKAIVDLASDKKAREQLSVKAREVYLSGFTEERMISLHRHLYMKCLDL